MSLSVVEYYGEQNRQTCGYCKGKKTSFTHGMHAYMLTTQDYQDLIDRGWRRSGTYCYKPNNEITCCPCYTIKCDSQEFKLSKSHKKILKRMNKFLKDGIKDKNIHSANTSENIDKDENLTEPREIVNIPNMTKREINPSEIKIKEDIASCNKINDHSKIGLKKSENVEPKRISCSDPSLNVNCKKAKYLRMQRKIAKLEEKGLPTDLVKKKSLPQEKSLSDFINNTSENDRHKLKILLLPSHEEISPQVLDLYQKYQVAIHKDPPQNITKYQFERFLCSTPLEVMLMESKSRECLSKLKETYDLYAKYQTIVHNDPPESLNGYLEFLQKSPLKHHKPVNGPPEGFGSYHQQYWLDDKLIAVGVIDILPKCVSSVYFFYDPEYSFLSLGTYASLREIDLVQKLSQSLPTLKYYYMGFYIHSCPKMRYKAKLSSSYLLCPEKYTWHLFTDEMTKTLDENKYQVFGDPSSNDENEFTRSDLSSVLILFQKDCYAPYREYKQLKKKNCDNTILEYGNLVGKSCALRMLFLAF